MLLRPLTALLPAADPTPAPVEAADPASEAGANFWERALEWFLKVPLQIIIIIAVTVVVIGVGHMLINRAVNRLAAKGNRMGIDELRRVGDTDELGHALLRERYTQRANALGSLLRSSVTLIASFIAVLTVLPLLGIDIAPLLTSAGVLGVALGFGAQNLVKDYLSGIYIVLEDQYGVGDMVEISKIVGRVEEVTLRVTRLRDLSGVVWYIRNGEILTVGNRSQGWTVAAAEISVPATTSLDRVREIAGQVGASMMSDESLDEVLLSTPKYAGVDSVKGDAMVITFVAKVAPDSEGDMGAVLRERLMGALDEAGIPADRGKTSAGALAAAEAGALAVAEATALSGPAPRGSAAPPAADQGPHI